MSKQTEIKTWTQLADALGVARNTLAGWRKQSDSPKSKSLPAWNEWRDNRPSMQGQTTAAESATMAELRMRLTTEQARKEAALASLRELELKTKADHLVPESAAQEVIVKTLRPLRSLLDSLPRAVAAQANPENPQIAELAVRTALDERVFGPIQKILSD